MENKNIYEEIGKTLAPVEIESEEALQDFGITKKDLVPYHFGNKRIMVYPYPAPEAVCREMLRELRQRYGYESRRERCMILSKSGGLIGCPERESCRTCPLAEEFRRPSQVSLDAALESDMEFEDGQADFLPELFAEDFISRLEEVDPRYVTMLQMKLDGASVAEISRRLQLHYQVVYYAFGKIREIASRYFDLKQSPV